MEKPMHNNQYRELCAMANQMIKSFDPAEFSTADTLMDAVRDAVYMTMHALMTTNQGAEMLDRIQRIRQITEMTNRERD